MKNLLDYDKRTQRLEWDPEGKELFFAMLKEPWLRVRDWWHGLRPPPSGKPT